LEGSVLFVFRQRAPQLFCAIIAQCCGPLVQVSCRKGHRLAFAFLKGSTGPAVSVIAAVLFFFAHRRAKIRGKATLNLAVYNNRQKTGAGFLIALLDEAAAQADGSGALESWWLKTELIRLRRINPLELVQHLYLRQCGFFISPQLKGI